MDAINANRDVELGTITEVHIEKEYREIFVSVECGPSHNYRGIPFYTGSKNEWKPPREGDEVEVFQWGKNRHAARKPKFPLEERQKGWHKENNTKIVKPDDLIEDDICLRFEDGSEFFIRRELDGGEEKRSLYIRMSGDIHLEAGGQVKDKSGVDPESDPEYFPEDRKRDSFK